MTTYKKRSKIRLITAATLICASFLSAYILSSVANRSVLMWSAKSALIPGKNLSGKELVQVKVSLSSLSPSYISGRVNLSGFRVLRNVRAGELIPADALTSNVDSLEIVAVPLSVQSADLPSDLQMGEIVNIYHVGDSRLAKEIGPPELILSSVYVIALNRQGENLGGQLALTVAVPAENVLTLLDATASGRIVLVRIHG
ncbi:MAG: hypothetical protein F2704_05985 [Actinobacteria bacterium]|uniref:Unannotated protein n=1 Tax=freshwater metagenome TaxID=449393 RepID=A0A6J7TZ13_9ZZZZ|nr:hypothetical protein [Actinomycetota bacterium]MSW47565.1 hypothetical protein [Actinomycetota bacterium]MSX24932.1 hypothetical protein [Actinomycetota bacterium]MSY46242.1 hypothetical protein [Actinomycetota bacterium]MSY57790.1 hypothetical protein [Actinomycetota bacterium]